MKDRRQTFTKRLLAMILMIAVNLAGPAVSPAQRSDGDLIATVNLKPDEVVTPETPIEFTLSRALKPNERIAVTIEHTDLSSLFTQTENRFAYDAKIMGLPVGKSTLTIYLVAVGGVWKEIGRQRLIVEMASTKPEIKEAAEAKPPTEPVQTTEESKPAAKGDEKKVEETKVETAATETKTEKGSAFKFLPSFTISIPTQPFQSNFPASGRPATRAIFADFDLTGSIKTEAKQGNFSSETNFDFAGSSFKDKTLQFGTLGKEAPDVDLSSYLMNFQVGKAKFSLGHTSFGGNRHLVSSFSSRGLSINIPINKRFDLTGGILNGTSVLGINNFFGMSKVQHQVQGATLGIEILTKRPGAIRVEVSGFNGYLQALNNVSEGKVVDAEQSRGFGLRVVATDKSERLKVEAGYALSRFFNPRDTTLDPAGVAVAIPAVMRGAHYLDSSYKILKDKKVTKTKNLNLSVAYRHEYVEPLYKSLGASASADKFSQEVTADASIGDITFQVGHARNNDNLRNVPSILKSLTRSNRFSLALPLAALLSHAEKPSPFFPRLGYTFDRTHNFGAGVPVKGGFEVDLTTIPDLVNTNQGFTAGWQFKKFGVDTTYSRTFADNRQKVKEGEDQLGWTRGISLKLDPMETLSFSFGLTKDSQRNFKLNTFNQTTSATFGISLKPFKGATLTGDMSHALAGDRAKTSLNRNVNFSAQFAYTFSHEKSKFNKFGTQVFVRYADAYVHNQDFTAVSVTLTRTRIVTAGLTFNIF